MLRDELLALQLPGKNELARAGSAANMLAELYADAIARALSAARLAPDDIRAAGVHGQTLRHRPDLGITVQLNNAARVAEKARPSWRRSAIAFATTPRPTTRRVTARSRK